MLGQSAEKLKKESERRIPPFSAYETLETLARKKSMERKREKQQTCPFYLPAIKSLETPAIIYSLLVLLRSSQTYH